MFCYLPILGNQGNKTGSFLKISDFNYQSQIIQWLLKRDSQLSYQKFCFKQKYQIYLHSMNTQRDTNKNVPTANFFEADFNFALKSAIFISKH